MKRQIMIIVALMCISTTCMGQVYLGYDTLEVQQFQDELLYLGYTQDEVPDCEVYGSLWEFCDSYSGRSGTVVYYYEPGGIITMAAVTEKEGAGAGTHIIRVQKNPFRQEYSVIFSSPQDNSSRTTYFTLYE